MVDKIVEGKSVSGIDNTLKEKIETAVEEEKPVVVEVETANVQETKVTDDAKKVKAKINNTEKVAAYYDVGVAIKVDNQKVGNVTQLENKITISVPIPTSLPAVPSGHTRVYKIIRVHNGVAEEINPSVSNGNLSFKTDKFSTYAVVYEDVRLSGSDDTPTTTKKPSGGNVSSNPQTSTTGIVIAWIIGILAIGYSLYYFSKTNKNED